MRIPSTLALVALLALLALAAAPLAAQSRDVLISATDTAIFEISNGGVMVSTLATIPGARSYITGIAPSLDNRGIVISWIHAPSTTYTYMFSKLDPTGKLTTIWSGAQTFAPTIMFPDFDGNWMAANSYGQVFRFRSGNPVTITQFQGQTGNGALFNEETGQLIFRGQSGFSSTLIGGFFALDLQQRTVTTLATCHYLSMGVSRFLYEADTGTYVDTHRVAQVPPPPTPAVSSLVRVAASTGLVNFPKQGLTGYTTALAKTGPRGPGGAYYALERNWPTTTQTSVLTRLMADGTRLVTTTIAGYPPRSSRMFMIRKHSRHLVWGLTNAPNDRILRVSFPGESGRTYVVGLSFTGVRPGPMLPDGRVIPLVPDNLTRLCMAGGVPGVLERPIGVLDSLGEARVRVNLNSLGKVARGLRLWATAVVLDPRAPFGVAGIAGPLLLQGK